MKPLSVSFSPFRDNELWLHYPVEHSKHTQGVKVPLKLGNIKILKFHYAEEPPFFFIAALDSGRVTTALRLDKPLQFHTEEELYQMVCEALEVKDYQPFNCCLRCGKTWQPRSAGKPSTCPKCRSPYWNKERERKNLK